MKYQVITTYNEKGGVGKSTTAAHLSFSLARYGRVLLIDGDPQGDATKHFFDPSVFSAMNKCYGSLLLGLSSFEESVVCAREPAENFNGVYILGTTAEDRKLNQFIQNEIRETPRKIRQIVKEAKLSGYDFIVFDLPTLWDYYHQLVLECCDMILPVVRCENLAVSHLYELIEKLKVHRENFESSYDLKYILANEYDKDAAMEREFLKVLTDIEYFHTFVCSKSNEIPKSTLNNMVLQEFKKNHPAVEVYDSIAKTISEEK